MGPRATALLNPRDTSVKVEIDLVEDGSAAASSKKQARYSIADLDDDDIDDDDDDDGGDDKTKTEKKQRVAKKLSELSAENRILHRCKTDLKRLIKQQCTRNGVKNETTLFPNKMLLEMIMQMPATRDALLRITYYTENLYNNYGGEEFLKIFQHYGRLVKEVQDEEAKKQEEAAAKKKAAASVASAKNAKTYGLIDTSETPAYNDYDASTYSSNNWNSASNGSSGGKRKYANNSSSSYGAGGGHGGGGGGGGGWKSKKPKTSNFSNSEGGGDGEGNSSGYFKKGAGQKSMFKKKNWKFKGGGGYAKKKY